MSGVLSHGAATGTGTCYSRLSLASPIQAPLCQSEGCTKRNCKVHHSCVNFSRVLACCARGTCPIGLCGFEILVRHSEDACHNRLQRPHMLSKKTKSRAGYRSPRVSPMRRKLPTQLRCNTAPLVLYIPGKAQNLDHILIYG